MRKFFTMLCALGFGLLAQTAAHAEVGMNDLLVIGRALSFLEKPLTGEVSVGIVYAADNAQSAREAENLRKLLNNGQRIGNLSLKPVLVSINEIEHADVKLLMLTAGMGEQAKTVGLASTRRRVPCVTTDLAQVKSGYCMMGVRSQPKVEILVNRSLAAAGGTGFSSVFRMMVTEI